MAVGDIGYFQQTTGQTPTASWAKITFDSQVRNDNSHYPHSSPYSDFTLPAGRYLVIYRAGWFSAIADRIHVEVGCFVDGTAVNGSKGYGYTRDATDSAAMAGGQCIIDVDGTEDVSIQTVYNHAPSGAAPFWSQRVWVQFVQLPSNAPLAYYDDSTQTTGLDGTSFANMTWDSGTDSDSATLAANDYDITLAAGKKYLILYGSAFVNTTTNRKAVFTRALIDGSVKAGSMGYAYMRWSNVYGNVNCMFFHETGSSGSEVLKLQAARSQSTGTSVGAFTRVAGHSGIWVLELGSGVEVFQGKDGAGGKDISSTSWVYHNIAHTVESTPSTRFAYKSTNTKVTFGTSAGDVLLLSNIYTIRTTGNGTRLTRELAFILNGTRQWKTQDINYQRGTLSSQDVDDSVHYTAAIHAVSSLDYVEAVTSEQATPVWSDGGNNPVTTTSLPAGFAAIDLDSLHYDSEITATLATITLTKNDATVKADVDTKVDVTTAAISVTPLATTVKADIDTLVDVTTAAILLTPLATTVKADIDSVVSVSLASIVLTANDVVISRPGYITSLDMTEDAVTVGSLADPGSGVSIGPIAIDLSAIEINPIINAPTGETESDIDDAPTGVVITH